MATKVKNVAAVSIPSDQNFVVIATAIVHGETVTRDAVAAAEAAVAKARASALECVAFSMKGFPAITETMWKETYAAGLRTALTPMYANPDSVKSTLTRWKRAIMAISAGHTVKPGETLNGYTSRLFPSAKTGKGRGGADKPAPVTHIAPDTRAPQLPIAAADTIEADFDACCVALADGAPEGMEAKCAQYLHTIFENAAHIEAFMAWAPEYFAQRVTKAKKGFVKG